MKTIMEMLREISTGDVVYDNAYYGYLYKLRDEYAPNKYILFTINVITNNIHKVTPTLYELVIKKGEPYLYFSRLYPDLTIAQYYLVEGLKDKEPSDELKVFIDKLGDNYRPGFYVNGNTIMSAYFKYLVAKLLGGISLSDMPEMIKKFIRAYRRQDRLIWDRINSFMYLDAYIDTEKKEINEIFNKAVFNSIFRNGKGSDNENFCKQDGESLQLQVVSTPTSTQSTNECTLRFDGTLEYITIDSSLLPDNNIEFTDDNYVVVEGERIMSLNEYFEYLMRRYENAFR